MAKLRYPAKVTHIRYGICNSPASFEILKKVNIIPIIDNHKSIKIINAARYSFAEKNTGDQIKFKNNCNTKNAYALVLL